MKMKTMGDIFTASSMGWGRGCKYCTHSPNFFGGGGEERKKRMCTDWYAES